MSWMLLELPSGTVVNLELFIALYPDWDKGRDEYCLILKGYAEIIYVDSNDANAIKEFLAKYYE
jgi:hypothetical protein